MPRFVTDSRPISAQHPITEFYREEFVKHHRCLQQHRPYYSESAITDVEAALTRIMGQLEQLCTQDNADELVSSLLKKFDVVTGLSDWSDPNTRTDASARPPSIRPPGNRSGWYSCRRSRRARQSCARQRRVAGTFRSARESSCTCLAVGKAARGMAAAAARRLGPQIRDGLIVTTEPGAWAVSGPSSAAIRCRRRPANGRPSRAATRRSGQRGRHTAGVAVRRGVGADGGSDRRASRSPISGNDGAALEQRRDIDALNSRAQTLVGDQGRAARGGSRGRVLDAGDLGRRRRRSDRHRIGTDRRGHEHVRRRASRAR